MVLDKVFCMPSCLYLYKQTGATEIFEHEYVHCFSIEKMENISEQSVCPLFPYIACDKKQIIITEMTLFYLCRNRMPTASKQRWTCLNTH